MCVHACVCKENTMCGKMADDTGFVESAWFYNKLADSGSSSDSQHLAKISANSPATIYIARPYTLQSWKATEQTSLRIGGRGSMTAPIAHTMASSLS